MGRCGQPELRAGVGGKSTVTIFPLPPSLPPSIPPSLPSSLPSSLSLTSSPHLLTPQHLSSARTGSSAAAFRATPPAPAWAALSSERGRGKEREGEGGREGGREGEGGRGREREGRVNGQRNGRGTGGRGTMEGGVRERERERKRERDFSSAGCRPAELTSHEGLYSLEGIGQFRDWSQ